MSLVKLFLARNPSAVGVSLDQEEKIEGSHEIPEVQHTRPEMV
jgi:hypothetical protein